MQNVAQGKGYDAYGKDYQNFSAEQQRALLKAVDQQSRAQGGNVQDQNQRTAGMVDIYDKLKQETGKSDADINKMLKSKVDKGEIGKHEYETLKKIYPGSEDKKTSQPADKTSQPAGASKPAQSSAPQVQASPIDFQPTAGTNPIADTSLGQLRGGASLGSTADNYLSPSMRAELANQSGGTFTADLNQNRQQFGYQQDFGNNLTGQLAVNRNAQGGMSAGIGAEKRISKDLAVGGGVSTSTHGQGGPAGQVYLKYNLKESLENDSDINLNRTTPKRN